MGCCFSTLGLPYKPPGWSSSGPGTSRRMRRLQEGGECRGDTELTLESITALAAESRTSSHTLQLSPWEQAGGERDTCAALLSASACGSAHASMGPKAHIHCPAEGALLRRRHIPEDYCSAQWWFTEVSWSRLRGLSLNHVYSKGQCVTI